MQYNNPPAKIRVGGKKTGGGDGAIAFDEERLAVRRRVAKRTDRLTLQRNSLAMRSSGASRLGRPFRTRAVTLGTPVTQTRARVLACSAGILKRDASATKWAAEAAAPL